MAARTSSMVKNVEIASLSTYLLTVSVAQWRKWHVRYYGCHR